SLLSQFDGRAAADVVRAANQSLGDHGFSEADALAVIQWGLQTGLLTLGPSAIQPLGSSSSLEAVPRSAAARKAWSLLSIRIPLGSPDRWCERVLPWVGWLFGKPAFVVWLLLIVMALHEVAVDWERFAVAIGEILIPANWFGLGLAWLVLKVIHESAHALICKRHGGEVRQVGIALIMFAPVAYVDVTSCWRFPSRWQRIHTAAAGIYAETAIAALAILTASRWESPLAQHFLDNVAV